MKPLHLPCLLIAVLSPLVRAEPAEPVQASQITDTSPAAAAAKTGKHLFILSGQSNMNHMPAAEFKAVVAKEFGEENVAIAMSAKNGASIRFWDKEFPWLGDGVPQGRKKPGQKPVTKEEYLARFGELYDKLAGTIKKSADGKTFDSVTLVWMQGESDSDRDPKFYFECFDRVVARLKSDFKFESMNIVIGRLSDNGIHKPHWVKFREGQVEYAEAAPYRAWINTDDLNDKVRDNGETYHDLHYTAEGYKILAHRFAEKSIELIKKNPPKNQ